MLTWNDGKSTKAVGTVKEELFTEGVVLNLAKIDKLPLRLATYLCTVNIVITVMRPCISDTGHWLNGSLFCLSYIQCTVSKYFQCRKDYIATDSKVHPFQKRTIFKCCFQSSLYFMVTFRTRLIIQYGMIKKTIYDVKHCVREN